ncbi:MAG TPA: PAS domain S-box protein, partial [Thermoanaerobaculia bacterium]|nr:PAS domain S-box protein [Thermoanaerobaculia bacterium]
MSARKPTAAQGLAAASALAVLAVLGFAFAGAGHLERWRKATTFTVRDADGAEPAPRGAAELIAAERALGAIEIAGVAGLALALAAWLARRRSAAWRDDDISDPTPRTTRPPNDALGDTMLESRELFAQSHDLVFVLDAQERFGAVNPRWVETMGYPREEVLALRFSDLLRPDQIPFWQQIFAAARLGERSPSFETVLLSKDGREILVEGFCWPRLDPDGRFVELRGLLLDVSDRQRAEREQALGEERFRNLFQRIPSSLLIYDRRNFAILGANERALEQYGYSRSEILAQRWTDLLAPEELPRADTLREEASVALAGAWRHRRADGGI